MQHTLSKHTVANIVLTSSSLIPPLCILVSTHPFSTHPISTHLIPSPLSLDRDHGVEPVVVLLTHPLYLLSHLHKPLLSLHLNTSSSLISSPLSLDSDHGVEPVVVFDGKRHLLKSETQGKREEGRVSNMDSARRLVESMRSTTDSACRAKVVSSYQCICPLAHTLAYILSLTQP